MNLEKLQETVARFHSAAQTIRDAAKNHQRLLAGKTPAEGLMDDKAKALLRT